jgi:hypothetical protein
MPYPENEIKLHYFKNNVSILYSQKFCTSVPQTYLYPISLKTFKHTSWEEQQSSPDTELHVENNTELKQGKERKEPVLGTKFIKI